MRKRQTSEMEKELLRREEEDKAERKRQHELAKREAERVARQTERRKRQQDVLASKQNEARKKAELDDERELERLERIERKRADGYAMQASELCCRGHTS